MQTFGQGLDFFASQITMMTEGMKHQARQLEQEAATKSLQLEKALQEVAQLKEQLANTNDELRKLHTQFIAEKELHQKARHEYSGLKSMYDLGTDHITSLNAQVQLQSELIDKLKGYVAAEATSSSAQIAMQEKDQKIEELEKKLRMEAFQREEPVAQSMLQKDQLLLENANLKQQLALLKASSSRPNIAPTSTRPEARPLETEGTVQQEMPLEEPISAPATEP
ncbi:hypothetical protein GOP47_0025272 [Adiantum capillus-veneris]|uniref:Uncharacterized protein n=1 Tax=Adiantum capillus-veneris TaxID=13818 RepID=A0A9D4U102_ADICA|nr:hypothetical protein GOP47_0025272 [Adiantum capillus-veneris]